MGEKPVREMKYHAPSVSFAHEINERPSTTMELTWLRILGPILLSVATAWGLDFLMARSGMLPPYFQLEFAFSPEDRWARLERRLVAGGILTIVLWFGVFSPLGSLGQEVEWDLASLTAPQLFLLHGMLVFALICWYGLGFGGLSFRQVTAPVGWPAQLGFRAPVIGREIGIGLVVGVGAWLVTLGVLLGVALFLWQVVGEEALPKEPPPVIPWIAALPVWIRLLLSLSAGVVEETFFRGFLQPRVGIAASTALFVLAHASYEQPLMLVGVGLLSLIYAFLVKWRQNIWPAIAAHALFDAVQLLVVIPKALEFMQEGLGRGLTPVALWVTGCRGVIC
jgi:membrane protease YdiL (CAAX protease family)